MSLAGTSLAKPKGPPKQSAAEVPDCSAKETERRGLHFPEGSAPGGKGTDDAKGARCSVSKRGPVRMEGCRVSRDRGGGVK